jgi:ribonuclease D
MDAKMNYKINLYKEDLPGGLIFNTSVAVDTEAMGLNYFRDRLCLVQLSDVDQNVHCVQFAKDSDYSAPNLKKLMLNPEIEKIFHYARFDVGGISASLKVEPKAVYCTKIASYLVRTYTNNHGLKDLCKELLGVDLSKAEQSSDWGSDTLTPSQLEYAARDVIYLHRLKEKLDGMLEREGRKELAHNCFEFITTRAFLDLLGMEQIDIFAHSLRNS